MWELWIEISIVEMGRIMGLVAPHKGVHGLKYGRKINLCNQQREIEKDGSEDR